MQVDLYSGGFQPPRVEPTFAKQHVQSFKQPGVNPSIVASLPANVSYHELRVPVVDHISPTPSASGHPPSSGNNTVPVNTRRYAPKISTKALEELSILRELPVSLRLPCNLYAIVPDHHYLLTTFGPC